MKYVNFIYVNGVSMAMCRCNTILVERCWFRCDTRTDKTRGLDHQLRLAGENCDRERFHPRALFCDSCAEFVAVREFSPPHRLFYIDKKYDVVGAHLSSCKASKSCPTCGHVSAT